MSKKGVSKKNVQFLFLSILCWKKKKRKHEKNGKINFQKKPRKIVFFGWLWRKMFFFVNCHFFWKIGKHYLCSEGKKRCAFSLQLSVFGKCHFFWCPFKVTKHYKNRGFSRHRGKPKMALLLQKCHFGFALEKGFYYLWCLKAVLRWKHYFYSVFSKTQLCRHERMQLEQNKKLPKIGVVCQNAKRSLFGMFFCFLVVLFFVACVFVLCFVKRPKTAIFLQF